MSDERANSFDVYNNIYELSRVFTLEKVNYAFTLLENATRLRNFRDNWTRWICDCF